MTSQRINLTMLNGNRFRTLIRRDRVTPGRIYAEMPKYASLSEEEVINLANALADVLEDH